VGIKVIDPYRRIHSGSAISWNPRVSDLSN